MYLISNALSGVTVGIFLVLYNLYLVSLGYGPDFIGVVLFVASIGAGIAIFPAGICVDRFSGKAVLIWSSALIGVAGIGQILFRQPVSLLTSGFIAGVGAAFQLVVNAPFLTVNSTPEERPHLFSVNIVLGLVTIVVGKILGGALPIWFRGSAWLMAPLPPWLALLLANQSQPRSYQFALLFAGIIAGPSFIPLFFMSNDHPRSRRGRFTVPTADLSAVGTVNRPLRERLRQARNVPVRAVIASPIFLLTLVQILIGAGAGLFVPYANLFFVQHLGASSALFGLIDGGATTLTALMTLVAPFLAVRIGKVNSIVLTQLVSIPLLVALGLSPLLPLVAIFYLSRQPLMDMAMGILQVFSMEAAPRPRRGLANSSYQAGFQIANAITASLGGFIIVQFGYPPLFIGAAICYLLAITTLWRRFGQSYAPLKDKDEGVGSGVADT
ncbi:MAG TPA: MFS transporter [Ktedonobacteraceae bacterium]|nr:MFS transporter [Ktedonobacteraceae bacterium]